MPSGSRSVDDDVVAAENVVDSGEDTQPGIDIVGRNSIGPTNVTRGMHSTPTRGRLVAQTVGPSD